MIQAAPVTVFDQDLSDELDSVNSLTLQQAEEIFRYFKDSPLFRWSDANNDCEDRANAICILLDAWRIPQAKGWVFSGTFRKLNQGNLLNCWNYHVAAVLPVAGENGLTYFVVDPATAPVLQTIDEWALRITESGTSYHFIKRGNVYIFPPGKIEKDNWYTWDRRNYNWTMQGLSGINGVSSVGKAQLAFNKRSVAKTADAFRKIKGEKPVFVVTGS